ncbi:Pre-rRNA-processing protein fhl1 [Borealophlyctis nickersoniae]|nr:Pre-rRNA-processing protein fhl1 [Borealophlyctis nickersoniae]
MTTTATPAPPVATEDSPTQQQEQQQQEPQPQQQQQQGEPHQPILKHYVPDDVAPVHAYAKLEKFEMSVYGKNGAFINDKHVSCNSKAVPLDHGSKLRIGDIELYFILPRMEPQSPMPTQIQEQKLARRPASPTPGQDEQNPPPAKKQKRSSPEKRDPKNPIWIDTSVGQIAAASEGSGSSASPSRKDSKPKSAASTTPSGYEHQRPSLSYAALIAEAIGSAPEGRITLKDMYTYISEHYPFYSLDQTGWQNCLRHTLSLHKAFVKTRRTEKGKGAWWSLDKKYEHLISPVTRRPRDTYPVHNSSQTGTAPTSRVFTLPVVNVGGVNVGGVQVTVGPGGGVLGVGSLPTIANIDGGSANGSVNGSVTSSLSGSEADMHLQHLQHLQQQQQHLQQLQQQQHRQQLPLPVSVSGAASHSNGAQTPVENGTATTAVAAAGPSQVVAQGNGVAMRQ